MTRAVVVNGAGQAAAAAGAAADLGQDLTLISGPGGARSVGPGWFAAVVAAAQSAAPARRVTGVLRCDDAPGLALAALRSGVNVALDREQPSFDKVKQIAAREKAEVFDIADWDLLDLTDVADGNVAETVLMWLEAAGD